MLKKDFARDLTRQEKLNLLRRNVEALTSREDLNFEGKLLLHEYKATLKREVGIEGESR